MDNFFDILLHYMHEFIAVNRLAHFFFNSEAEVCYERRAMQIEAIIHAASESS